MPGNALLTAAILIALSGESDWRDHLKHGAELQTTGSLALARKEFEAAVVSARKSGDDYAPGIALNSLANFYDETGDFGQEELVLAKSLSEWQRILGREDTRIARIIQRLALVYIEKGELSNAAKLDLPGWIARVEFEAPGSEELLDLFEASAALESASQHFSRAVDLHRQALELLTSRGSDPAAAAIALNNFGVVYLRAKQFDQAISFLMRSLDMWTSSPEPRDAGTFAMIAQNLGEAFTGARRYAEAEKILESATPAATRAYSPDSPRLAGFLMVKAQLAHAEKHAKEAKELDRQVKSIVARYQTSDPSRRIVDVSSFAAVH